MDLTPEVDGRVTNGQLRGFIERAGGHGAAGAESLVVIFRHLLNEEYQAGREDAAREVNIDKIRQAARHLCARIIASAHLLDVPFTDARDQSPWTKAKRDMAALYDAVGINVAISLGRSAGGVGDNPEEQRPALDQERSEEWRR